MAPVEALLVESETKPVGLVVLSTTVAAVAFLVLSCTCIYGMACMHTILKIISSHRSRRIERWIA